jgi:hypothetical protein
MHRSAAVGAALFALAFPSTAASATVVAQWNMDNTFGNTMEDSSGNGNDGTTYNIVTSGGGYIFNGTTSKVVVPSAASLNPGTNAFSITLKIETDTVPGGDYDLLRKGLGTTSGGDYKIELIRVNGQARAFCEMKDKAGHKGTVTGTTNLADNKLHTITCTKSSSNLKLQVDSLAVRTKSVSLGSISNTKALTIGVKSPTFKGSGGDWYKGTFRSASISVGP